MTRRTGMRVLRIAMIGQKGIPARYGGVETHVEHVATRLAARGHTVWVFCRARFRPDAAEAPADYRIVDGVPTYRGVRLVYRRSIVTKHLDAATHTFACAVEAGLRRRFDIVHFHGIGPAAFAPIPHVMGRTVVSTFHALDWRQVKWGAAAKRWLRAGERVGARWSDGLIAVSRLMQDHIRREHGVDSVYIPNGAVIPEPRGPGAIDAWDLRGDDYVLTVGRIIRDRELHTLIEAHRGLDSGLKLVIVGSESPRTSYSDELARLAGPDVVFTGDVFGEPLEDLYANCRAYVLASRVEGLPITVCEAMAHRRAVVLSDIPENREVGGDAAAYFNCGNVNSLRESLRAVVEDDEARRAMGEAGARRVRDTYNWDWVADQIEAFYYEVLGA